MFCNNCGKLLSEGMAFCPYCGQENKTEKTDEKAEDKSIKDKIAEKTKDATSSVSSMLRKQSNVKKAFERIHKSNPIKSILFSGENDTRAIKAKGNILAIVLFIDLLFLSITAIGGRLLSDEGIENVVNRISPSKLEVDNLVYETGYEYLSDYLYAFFTITEAEDFYISADDAHTALNTPEFKEYIGDSIIAARDSILEEEDGDYFEAEKLYDVLFEAFIDQKALEKAKESKNASERSIDENFVLDNVKDAVIDNLENTGIKDIREGIDNMTSEHDIAIMLVKFIISGYAFAIELILAILILIYLATRHGKWKWKTAAFPFGIMAFVLIFFKPIVSIILGGTVVPKAVYSSVTTEILLDSIKIVMAFIVVMAVEIIMYKLHTGSLSKKEVG